MSRILVVVDMQNDFIDGALGTAEAQGIVEKAVEKISGFEGDILVTMDTHEEDYLQSQEGRNLPVPHCIRKTWGWQLNPRVKAALEKKGYTAVEKPSFGSLLLPDRIRLLGGEKAEIQLVGLCTDICVVSNALLLKAHFPEARIGVDASCCAGVNLNTHEAALATMASCQIEIQGL